MKKEKDFDSTLKFSLLVCFQLLGSGILFELDASQMVEVLESDFVNACELDILKCVLRWGEHELLRRIEERGRNKFFLPRL